MELVGVGATRTQVGLRHNLEIKDISNKTTVGDDCRTKLMYYLSCFSYISKFLDVHPGWLKYTEYEKNRNWTIEEEEELLHICRDVVPLNVAKSIGFIEVPDELLDGWSAKFYEVTDTNEVLFNQIHVHISEDSVYAGNRTIGAKSEMKMKVLMYSVSWIDKYYYDALKELSNMIYKHKQERKEEEEKRLHPEIWLEKQRKKEEERRRKEEEERRKERERRERERRERERREEEERRERERRDRERRERERREEEERREREEERKKEGIIGIRGIRKYRFCECECSECVIKSNCLCCWLTIYFLLAFAILVLTVIADRMNGIYRYINMVSAFITSLIAFVMLLSIGCSCCCNFYIGGITVLLVFATCELVGQIVVSAISDYMDCIMILIPMCFIMCGLYCNIYRIDEYMDCNV